MKLNSLKLLALLVAANKGNSSQIIHNTRNQEATYEVVVSPNRRGYIKFEGHTTSYEDLSGLTIWQLNPAELTKRYPGESGCPEEEKTIISRQMDSAREVCKYKTPKSHIPVPCGAYQLEELHSFIACMSDLNKHQSDVFIGNKNSLEL